jgi:tetratricopeptide (TPR) repeat protein
LAEADAWHRQQKYPAALPAARRAEGLAAGSAAGRELRERGQQRRADLDLVLRLDEARLEPAAGVKDDKFDSALADRRYGEEFRAAGLAVDGLTPEEAAARVRATTVAVELAVALDYWVKERRAARGNEDAGWRHLLEVARRVDPDAFRYRLRDALAARDREALETLAKAPDVATLPASSLAALGSLLNNLDAPNQAVELLRAAQRRHPADFWINQALGWALHHSRPAQLEEAIRFYSVAVALRPQSPGARLNLAVVLREKGRLDEAVAACQETIRLMPDFALAHVNVGIALQDQGKLDEAIAAYQEAIRLKPDLVVAGMYLGRLLRQSRRPAEAEQVVRAAIPWQETRARAAPDAERDREHLAELYHLLWTVLIDAKRFQEALAINRDHVLPLFEQLAKDFPNQGRYRHQVAVSHFNLGVHLNGIGQYQDAEQALRLALKLEPDYADGHYGLAWLLATRPDIQLRDPQQAVVHASKAVELEPGNGRYWNTLGIAQYRHGAWKEAVEALTKSVQLSNAAYSSDFFFLAMAHWQLGDKEKAHASYDWAVAWMDQRKQQDEALRRFRAEAAALLGVDSGQ